MLGNLDALPGETAPQEVYHHVAQRDEVVAARQLEPLVRIHRHVPARPNQVLHPHEWNVLPSLWVNDEACQAKVNHEDGIRVIAQAHHNVVRLDVPVDVVLLMHVLHSI